MIFKKIASGTGCYHTYLIFTLSALKRVSADDIHFSFRLIANIPCWNVKWKDFPRFIVKLKGLSVKSGQYQNLAPFQNTYVCCVINSSRIHNPIAIIQIIFHIFRHSVSELNMTHLEFGPKFVMLATHPLEYLTTIGFVWQLSVAVFSLPNFFCADIFLTIFVAKYFPLKFVLVRPVRRRSNAVVMMDGARDEGGTIFSLLLLSISQNINRRNLLTL